MKRTIVMLAAFVSLGLWICAAQSGAQEHEHEGHDESHKAEHEHDHAHVGQDKPGDMGPIPIGPELKRLEQFVGTWKVEHKMWHTPDAEPQLSHGTEVYKLILDGRALVSEFESAGPEGTFKGHGLTIWNVVKQKYQGVWMDIYSYNGPQISWATCDDEGKNWTWKSQMMGFDGKMMSMRGTQKILDKDHQHMEFYATGPDGKEFKMMEFKYTRMK